MAIANELQVLASHAAVIFVGQITSIEHRSGIVEVSFRVEQPVRGAVGTTVLLREWAGTWAPGQSRYLLGQRVLAFLHAASPAGVSSPVHGAEGLVPVLVQGADAPRLLDIRRVAASVVRAAGTPLLTEANGAVQLADVLPIFAAGRTSSVAEPAHGPLLSHARAPMEMMPVTGPVPPGVGPVLRPGRPTLFSPEAGALSDAR